MCELPVPDSPGKYVRSAVWSVFPQTKNRMGIGTVQDLYFYQAPSGAFGYTLENYVRGKSFLRRSLTAFLEAGGLFFININRENLSSNFGVWRA